LPIGVLNGIDQFSLYFTVWHVALAVVPVEGQIAQVDEDCEYIILTPDDGHVVLETGGVNVASSACQHFDDVVFQPLVVHLDVRCNSIVCACAGPVAAAAALPECLHHGVGVEDGWLAANLVAVIPFHHLVKVGSFAMAECFHLLLGESEESCQTARIHHGVLIADVDVSSHVWNIYIGMFILFPIFPCGCVR